VGEREHQKLLMIRQVVVSYHVCAGVASKACCEAGRRWCCDIMCDIMWGRVHGRREVFAATGFRTAPSCVSTAAAHTLCPLLSLSNSSTQA
jgi:hypothetical protein